MSLDNSNVSNAINAEKQLGSLTLDYNGSILQVNIYYVYLLYINCY